MNYYYSLGGLNVSTPNLVFIIKESRSSGIQKSDYIYLRIIGIAAFLAFVSMFIAMANRIF